MFKIRDTLVIAIIIFISFFALRPLLIKGFFPMHDDTQPTRVYEMAEALGQGQFPVRWVNDLGYGYGYPIFNFYAPLPYYVGAAFVLIGFDVIIATKLMFSIGFLLSGILMYFLAKTIWSEITGLFVSILYMLAPYHAVQFYVRGSVGEYWAYAFVPLVFLGLILIPKSSTRGIILGGIGLGAVILSHNLTALMLSLFLFPWVLGAMGQAIKNKKWKTVQGIFFTLLLGLALSCWYWLPAVAESAHTKIATLTGGTNDFRIHFVYLDQLWDSPWGYAGSAAGRADGMSFKIGKLLILLFFSSVGMLIYRFFRHHTYPRLLMIYILGGAIFSIVMVLPISEPLWRLISPLSFIQYPWRFLLFICFFTSLSCGVLIGKKPFWQKHPVLYLVYGLVLGMWMFMNIKLFTPQYINAKSSRDYTDTRNIRWTISKISDEYLPAAFPIPQNEEETANQSIFTSNDIMVKELDSSVNRRRIVVSANNNAEIIFGIAYFPGWHFFVDTKEVIPKVTGGLPSVSISAGDHIVQAFFTDTPVRLIGNSVSLIGGCILIGLLVGIKRQGYEKD